MYLQKDACVDIVWNFFGAFQSLPIFEWLALFPQIILLIATVLCCIQWCTRSGSNWTRYIEFARSLLHTEGSVGDPIKYTIYNIYNVYPFPRRIQVIGADPVFYPAKNCQLGSISWNYCWNVFSRYNNNNLNFLVFLLFPVRPCSNVSPYPTHFTLGVKLIALNILNGH